MMPYTVKIQSYTDVITNSSSSVFLISDDRSLEEITEILEKFHNSKFIPPDSPIYESKWGDENYNWRGGDAGDLDIERTGDTYWDDSGSDYRVIVDRCCYATINYILDNFKVDERDSA